MKSSALYGPAPPAPQVPAAAFVCLLFALATTAAASELRISAAWARATVAGVPIAAAYFTVENRGKNPDTLLGANSPVAGETKFHRSTQQYGMAHMQSTREITIAPGTVLRAEPGGLHLMLMSLRQPLVAGKPMTLTLNFRRAGAVTVQVQVLPITAAAPAGSAAPDMNEHRHLRQ